MVRCTAQGSDWTKLTITYHRQRDRNSKACDKGARLVRTHPQLILHVYGRCCQEGVHARPLGQAHCLPCSVQVPAGKAVLCS